jgi:hypothetical protein
MLQATGIMTEILFPKLKYSSLTSKGLRSIILSDSDIATAFL